MDKLRDSLHPQWQLGGHRYNSFNEDERRIILGANFQGLEYDASLVDLPINELAYVIEGDMMVKGDRLGMYYQKEIRNPFLEEDVIAFAMRNKKYIWKYPGTKKLLKQLLISIHPTKFKFSKKMGFESPIDTLFKEFLGLRLLELVDNTTLLNKDYILETLNSHKTNGGKGAKLWTIYVYLYWLTKNPDVSE